MKKYLAILFLFVVLLTIVGCAKDEVDITEEVGTDNNTATAPEESYDPEVVDTLSEDLEALEW